MKAWLYLLLALFLLVPTAYAQPVMTYRYNAPESALDKRYDYQWKILQTALERTKRKYGLYRMVKSVVMTEKRQVDELERDSGLLTVMYLDTNPDMERKLVPIHIPVDKGLVGYRVFLIRKQAQAAFEGVNTLEDLRRFTYGLGLGWADVEVMQSNGFRVVTGSSYDGLFNMLVHNRFDVFSRSVGEVLDEYDERKPFMPDLFIEPDILLYYPLPMYFWFANSEHGRKLAARVEEGMWMMMRDGSYDRVFKQYYGDRIRQLNLAKRKLFKLDNPLLVPETPLDNRRLWIDLQPK